MKSKSTEIFTGVLPKSEMSKMKNDYEKRVYEIVARGEKTPWMWRFEGSMLAIRGAIGPKRIRSVLRNGSALQAPFSEDSREEQSKRFVQQFGRFRSTSQSYQDVFVQIMTEGLDFNHYLELGACHPVQVSNTFVLENYCGWQGLSVEIDQGYWETFNSERSNPCLLSDATSVNYEMELAQRGFPTELGYLSIDIDPSYQSLASLLAIPFETRRFAVITFEHDCYRSGKNVRQLQREILSDHGYQLVVADVQYWGKLAFEDWWVQPDLVPASRWQTLIANGVNPGTHLEAFTKTS